MLKMLSSVPKEARNNFEGGQVVEKMVNVKFKKKAIFKIIIFQGGSVQR